MLILLDLEETVIEDWSNMTLMPRECMAIRSFLRTCHPGATIGLMSWAVWNDRDKALFNKHLRDELEAVLEVKFSDEWLLSMDDWAKMLFHHCKKKLSRDETINHSSGNSQEVISNQGGVNRSSHQTRQNHRQTSRRWMMIFRFKD